MSVGREEGGFTLVELILALALIAIVLSGFMTVYWFGSKAFANENSMAQMQYEARACRNIMVSDICAAESLSVYASKGGSEIDDGITLGECLKILHCDVNGNTTRFVETYYYVANNQFYRQRWNLNVYLNPRDDRLIDTVPITENIMSVEFIKPVPGLIQYTIKAEMEGQAFELQGRCRSRVDYGMSNLEG